MADFELDEELLNLQQESFHIPNEIQIEGENQKTLERTLNVIVDRIGESSGSIVDPTLFGQLRSYIKHFNILNKTTANKAWDIVLSGFKAEIAATAMDLDANDQDAYMEHRNALEMYGFLILWIISTAESKATSKANADKGKQKGARAAKAKDDDESIEWVVEKQKALDLMYRCLELQISKIWTATHEKESFVSLFFKPAYQILENKNNIKVAGLKSRVYKLLCICVKRHNHAFGAQTTILQNLQYWEHTPEPMAEFLEMLINEYDYTQLAEDILRDVAAKDFNDVAFKDTSVSKAFAKFLLRLCELAPKIVLKQMGLLIQHLDGESYTIRQAIIEVIGCLIEHLSQLEQSDQVKNQIDGFFDIIEERFADNSSYVRTKVIGLVANIANLKTKFPKRRQRLTELVVGRLSDKSYWARRQAIKSLMRLIETHPYAMHGGELDLEEWEMKYTNVTEELQAMVKNPTRKKKKKSNAAVEGAEGKDTTDMELDHPEQELEEDAEEEEGDEDGDEIGLPTDEELLRLTSSKEYVTKSLQQRYYADAIRFIHHLHRAVPIVCELLASTMKLEVVEAMEFFVTIHRYKVQMASDGIRRMVHLIWMKDNGDEAKSVKARLVECYWQIYLAPDEKLNDKENTALVARNLVSLTYGITLAELTSLEQLLSTIVADSNQHPGNEITITDEVIEKLWQVYSHHKEIPNPQRRGAIIILGMLAKAKPEIVSQKMELLLKIGLGKHGRTDLALARYSCIALQRIAGEKKKQKGELAKNTVRLPMDHPVFTRLSAMIDHSTHSKQWFGVAEQVLNTIYLLGEHPDVLCGDIIKARGKVLFGLQEDAASSLDQMMLDVPMSQLSDMDTINTSMSPEHSFVIDSWQLSQLLFIVGHVAIKHIVHMEVIEEEFKRRKAAAGSDKKKKANAGDDELDQVVGTTEDEFGEAIAHIRERELLFGEESLLQVFGPMIVTICGNNTLYSDKTLQNSATLAMCKLMCVSSDFCEHNLQLLFTILEKSSEPAVRSNIIIALGDMAVCFNNLIDANIAYLYKRLTDSDNAVKKNTLMVLTHLVLNGMVKVKGQLGEMAICLVDEDSRISDLARLFFTELTSKDNAVYNNMPDIISHLSHVDNKVTEESYRKIMRFLFELIKEKPMENMIEKLCQRFKNTDSARGWRDIAFCLSMLPFKNERSFKRLLEGFPNYQDKVHEESVFKYMTDIVTKGRQQKPPKPELKPVIDEFEAKLLEFKAKGDEMQDTETKAITAVKKGTGKKGGKKGSSLAGLKVNAPKRTVAARRKGRNADDDDDDEEVEEAAGSDEEYGASKTTRKTRGTGNGQGSVEVEEGMFNLNVDANEAGSSRPKRSTRQASKDPEGDVIMDSDAGKASGDSGVDDSEVSTQKPSKATSTAGKGKAAAKKRATPTPKAAAAASKRKPAAKKSNRRMASSDDEDEDQPEPSDDEEDTKTKKKAASKARTRDISATPPPAQLRSKRAAAAKARRIIESSDEDEEEE